MQDNTISIRIGCGNLSLGVSGFKDHALNHYARQPPYIIQDTLYYNALNQRLFLSC